MTSRIPECGELLHISILKNVLLNKNPHVFAQRNVNSILDLLKYQQHGIYIYYLKITKQLQSDKWLDIQEKLKHFSTSTKTVILQKYLDNAENPIISYMNLLDDSIINLRQQIEKTPENENKLINEIMDYVEYLNNIILDIIGELYLEANGENNTVNSANIVTTNYYKTDVNGNEEYNFPVNNDILVGLRHINEKILSELNGYQPTGVKGMPMVYIKILNMENFDGIVTWVLTFFGNYLRRSNLFLPEGFDPIQILIDINKKYGAIPEIQENICLCIRNISVHYPQQVYERTSQEIIKYALKSSYFNTIMWASRCIGTIAAGTTIQNIRYECLLSIYDLFTNQFEDVICWSLSFIGTYYGKSSFFNDNNTIIQINQNFNDDISRMVERINNLFNLNSSPKIIEAALWCLGTLAISNNVVPDKKIPPNLLNYIQPQILEMYSNGEKIILYSCRCISNLTSSTGADKIPLGSKTLKTILRLLQIDNEKIVVWLICYLGSLSSNTQEYNAKTRIEVATEDIIKQIIDIILKSKQSKIIEAALWSFHKMSWCDQNKKNIRNCPKAIDIIIEYLMEDNVSEKITEGACLCFGVLFTTEDTIFTKGVQRLFQLISNINTPKQVILIATRTLNTLVTNATKECKQNRKFIGKNKKNIDQLINLFSIRNQLNTKYPDSNDSNIKYSNLILESLTWCLGNLSLHEDNAKYIRKKALQNIVELLKEQDDKVIEGACFCFCNLVLEFPTNNLIIDNKYNTISFLISLFDKEPYQPYKYHNKVIEAACWGLHKLSCSGNITISTTENITNEHGIITTDNILIKTQIGDTNLNINLCEKIMELGGFKKICELLKHENEKIIAGACWCFGKLVVIQDGIFWAVKLGAIKSLIRLINPNNKFDEKIRVLACRCLGTLAVNAKPEQSVYIQNDIGELGGVESILHLLTPKDLSHPNLALMETAIWCLASLSVHVGNKQKIINFNQGNKTVIKIIACLLCFKRNEKILEGTLFCLSNLLDNKLADQLSEINIRKIVECSIHPNEKISERATSCLAKISTNEERKKILTANHINAISSNLFNIQNDENLIIPSSLSIITEDKWFHNIITQEFKNFQQGFSTVVFFQNYDILKKFTENQEAKEQNYYVFDTLTELEKENLINAKEKRILTTRTYRNIKFSSSDIGTLNIITYISTSNTEDREFIIANKNFELILNDEEWNDFHNKNLNVVKQWSSIAEKREKDNKWTYETQKNIIISTLWILGNCATIANEYWTYQHNHWVFIRLKEYLLNTTILMDEQFVEVLCFCSGNFTAIYNYKTLQLDQNIHVLLQLLQHNRKEIVNRAALALINYIDEDTLPNFIDFIPFLLDILNSSHHKDILPLIIELISNNQFWNIFLVFRKDPRTNSFLDTEGEDLMDIISGDFKNSAISVIFHNSLNTENSIENKALHIIQQNQTLFNIIKKSRKNIKNYYMLQSIYTDLIYLTSSKIQKQDIKMLIYKDIENIMCQENFNVLEKQEKFTIVELFIIALAETDKDYRNSESLMIEDYPIIYQGQKGPYFCPYKDIKYYDMFFVIGENKIGANKMILAKSEISPYFVSLINYLPKGTLDVKLDEQSIDKDNFIILLEYIYNNEITFHSFQDIMTVYNLAKHHLILPLIKLAKNKIIQQINENEFHEALNSAKIHEDAELTWELYNWWFKNYQNHSTKAKEWFYQNWEEILKDVCQARKYKHIIV
jgi:hypothetical protein